MKHLIYLFFVFEIIGCNINTTEECSSSIEGIAAYFNVSGSFKSDSTSVNATFYQGKVVYGVQSQKVRLCSDFVVKCNGVNMNYTGNNGNEDYYAEVEIDPSSEYTFAIEKEGSEIFSSMFLMPDSVQFISPADGSSVVDDQVLALTWVSQPDAWIRFWYGPTETITPTYGNIELLHGDAKEDYGSFSINVNKRGVSDNYFSVTAERFTEKYITGSGFVEVRGTTFATRTVLNLVFQ